jgi:spermidine/putrescine-binding protein
MRVDFFVRWLIRIGIIIFWAFVFFIAISYQKSMVFDQNMHASLNILAWPQIIDREYLVDFENRYNVSVHITYCENNEEMLAKLSSSKQHGYDLVMPSNFFVKHCIDAGIIQKFNHENLPWLNNIDPQVRGLSFDRDNQYTIPCFWSVYGIGLNHKIYKKPLFEKSWKLIFNPSGDDRLVGMLEELPQTYALMGLYLYQKINNFTDKEHETIVNQLIEQKKSVLAYTDMRVEYLLVSGECGVVFSASSDMNKVVKLYPQIEFFVPKEGSFAILDSFAITSECQQKDLAYAFLAYLYDEGIISVYADKFDFPSPLERNVLLANTEVVHYFERIFSEKEYEDLWIKIKTT